MWKILETNKHTWLVNYSLIVNIFEAAWSYILILWCCKISDLVVEAIIEFLHCLYKLEIAGWNEITEQGLRSSLHWMLASLYFNDDTGWTRDLVLWFRCSQQFPVCTDPKVIPWWPPGPDHLSCNITGWDCESVGVLRCVESSVKVKYNKCNWYLFSANLRCCNISN